MVRLLPRIGSLPFSLCIDLFVLTPRIGARMVVLPFELRKATLSRPPPAGGLGALPSLLVWSGPSFSAGRQLLSTRFLGLSFKKLPPKLSQGGVSYTQFLWVYAAFHTS